MHVYRVSHRYGIHLLVWRPDIVGRTHHMCRSTRAEGAKPQRERETEDGSVRHQAGVWGEKERVRFRTYVLLYLEHLYK